MEKLTVEATVENLPQVTEFIIESLEERDCPPKILLQMELVIEELFVNVAHYAYRPDVGNCTVIKEFEENPQALIMTLIDSGIPYNPLEHEDPDTSLGVEEREIGGLGIFLVKKNVDEITYDYKDGKNVLRFKKLF
ncbi:MAG: ATP-binding protein [Selenomonadaceae bacterium]|nr:ATP-binding protein [Selenomonadaceae bacterium]MBQ7628896.1 ATP-binding protein [Selenomonadaceae bacterium]